MRGMLFNAKIFTETVMFRNILYECLHKISWWMSLAHLMLLPFRNGMMSLKINISL